MAPPKLVSKTTKATSLVKAVSLTSRAYVTFLAGNGDYVKGVVGLAKGLRKVQIAYPLVVAVLPDVPEEHRRILVAQGCIVREIEPVYPPENQTQFAMAYYVINYSKLRVWEFVEYHKMIYLDGDIQVFENIDHLFDNPNGCFYAVKDCFYEKTWSHTPQYKIGYCQQCPNKIQWPAELGPKPPLYFNASMFVYEPSLSVYEDLLNTVKIVSPTPFAEQDFLNMFFKDVCKPIPPIYNLVLAMLWRHPKNIELDKVKVVHYCAAGSKPWRYTGNEENMNREDIKMLVKKWWDIYNDESLDYKTNIPLIEGVALSETSVREQSGYGPDLRTGTAQSTSLPVEHYRQQVDEAENKLQGLLHRQPTPFEPHPIVPLARDPSIAMVLNQLNTGSHTPFAYSGEEAHPHSSETSTTTGSYDYLTHGTPTIHPAPQLEVAHGPNAVNLLLNPSPDQPIHSTLGLVVFLTCISPLPSHTHTEIAPALS
ncbi:Galactinol synthase 2 [Camellia lanceoleosa]|uniref:Galactinol synthase 2 n=1 Tax=Camellia lanceoleosa TaxID=1840588 RepID=A0ACC0ILZ9_9ERIC|nr:Galactinol synthase 2 [Camellia lanceoleosa]